VLIIPYGRTADGAWRILAETAGSGEASFTLAGTAVPFLLHIPGTHNVLNAAAALALCSILWHRERGATPPDFAAAAAALAAFRGSRRRCEVVGDAGGVLVIDDYAHHPTALRTTLEGIRRFYPGRRILVDFMSHTYSRTRALLGEFGASFAAADVVLLHRIYASAREKNESGISGRDLYDETSRRHPNVHYFEDPLDALPFLQSELRHGDVLVTMGAGDNWKLGREVLRRRGGPR
jgi:UDP-N-acetylmuramate--alanine ligase